MRGFGDAADDRVNQLAVDGSGNIYAAGSCTGRVLFDSIVTDGQGARDAVVFSLDPDGKVRWAFRTGGFDPEEAAALSLFSDGSIAVTIVHRHSVDVALGDTAPPASLIVIRLDSAGIPVWQFRMDASEWVNGHAAARADGGVLLGGAWSGVATFDGQSMESDAERSGFLIELGPDGAILSRQRLERPVARVVELEDGDMVLGTVGSGGMLEKRDSQGELKWEVPLVDVPTRFLPRDDGGVLLCAGGARQFMEPAMGTMAVSGDLFVADTEGTLRRLPEVPDSRIECGDIAGDPSAPVLGGGTYQTAKLARLTPSGGLAWNLEQTFSSLFSVHAVAVAPNDDIVMGGTFLGSVQVESEVVTSRGGSAMLVGDIFVARLRPSDQ